MKSQQFIFALTAISLLLAPAGWSADDAKEKLAKATQLIDKGKAKPAAVILREVIRANPNIAEAHMQLGAALASTAENDKYDEAIAEEQTAIKLDPKSSSAHRILGMIYANQKKFDQSIPLLKEACALKPTGFAAHKDLGTAYLSAGKLDDAVSAFQKALEIKPENVEVHTKLAVIFSKQKKYTEAINEANKAVKLGANQAETHLVLGNIKLESGDYAGAQSAFKDTIELNGYDYLGMKNPLTAASAFSGLGWAIASEKDADKDKTKMDEAVSNQKKAVKALPGFLPAYIRLAELYGRQGKNKDADSLYQNIFKATKYDAGVAASYSHFLEYTGRKNEAKDVLKKVLEKSPDNKQIADALAALDQPKERQ